MKRLNANNLPENVSVFDYDRSAVSSGIVHFGIGNFHRAHQAVYCDDLLKSGATQWGITGVSLRSATMHDALAPQDFLYTLATLGETLEYRIIGAVKNVLVAPQNPQAIIDLIATPATQVVSSTITEKGYYLSSGQVDFSHEAIRAEGISLDAPSTIYGYIARGIMQRCENSGDAYGLTILCCDNISGGGDALKAGVQHLLKLHNEKALSWSHEHVSYISSMVDRVCPTTDDALRDQVSEKIGHSDAWPVSAEPFSQWIIEDNFAGAKPAFDTVDAVFVKDITPFETMKLRYLNAAHSIASTLGYLNGDTFVHEALAHPDILNFTRQSLYENVLPNAHVPDGYDGASYIEQVIQRFRNSNLPYANLQVGSDTSQKIQQRWFPTIDAALHNAHDTSYFAFCLGAWVMFIQKAMEHGVLNDPRRSEFESVTATNLNSRVINYLEIAGAERFAFSHNAAFMTAVGEHAKTIHTNGVIPALRCDA